MKTRPCLLDGFTVHVDRVFYDPRLTAEPDRPHPFLYFITIHNRSASALTIKGRKWVVTEKEGGTIVMEGDGVVGCFPYLKPGEHFSYNSYHTIAHHAVATGAYLAMTDEGDAVIATIPAFEMMAPSSFRKD